MSDVATPDVEATEAPQVFDNDDQAVEAFSALLNPQGSPEPEVAEVEDDAEAEAEAEPENAEDEAEGISLEDLPDSLNGFAEEIGITAEELAGHLKIPAGKDENGNPVMVTLAEAIRGNLRQADYTAKTMELAEQRKAFAEQTQQVQQQWQQRLTALDSLIPQLQNDIAAPPDPSLIEEDPQEFLRLSERYRAKQEALNQANYVRQQAEEQQKQEMAQRVIAARKAEQQKLIELVPDLLDDAKRPQFESGLVETFRAYGFPKEEVAEYMKGAFDSRFIKMAVDAGKFRALETGKKTIAKKVKGLPKVVRPGAKRETSKVDEVADLKNRMLKSGREDDAV